MPALVLSPPAAPARLEDFSGLPPAYSFVGDGEPFYAETVYYFERLRAAGVPAQLDVYHCDMHAFDMMRPQDARFSVRMPDSWTPMFDLSDKAKVQRTNLAAEPQIDALIAHIRRRDRGDFMRAKVPLPAVRVYYPHYERARRTGYFAVTDACVGCGLCARNCPVSAIEIRDGRPVWVKEQCVMCLACLHRCPKFAIRRGKKTAGHGQYVHPEFAGK